MLEQQATQTSRTELKIGDLLQEVAPLHATDSLAKALSQFKTTGLPVLPVVDHGAVAGRLSEADLLDWVTSQGHEGGGVPDHVLHEAMVLAAMRPRCPLAFLDEPVSAAWPVMGAQDAHALPVVDRRGQYQGMVTRQSVIAALSGTLRPERIGGMATPFGVYLTTTHLAAGAGFFGLFATGLALTIVNWLLAVGLHHAQIAAGWILHPALEAVVALALFLVLLRLSPLSGYHAAEHQTVNAIERGEALDPDVVALMPREHPRCGTNLVALLFGAQLLLPLLAREPLWLLPAGALLYLSWRRIGTWLQRTLTTRPANRAQLQAGIQAGRALLAAYAASPGHRARPWRRLWNLGFLQVLAGALAALAVLETAYHLFPNLRGILL